MRTISERFKPRSFSVRFKSRTEIDTNSSSLISGIGHGDNGAWNFQEKSHLNAFHHKPCTLDLIFFVLCHLKIKFTVYFDTQTTHTIFLMIFRQIYSPMKLFFRVFAREAFLLLACPRITTENTRNIRRVSWKITKFASHCLEFFFHLLFMYITSDFSLPFVICKWRRVVYYSSGSHELVSKIYSKSFVFHSRCFLMDANFDF